MARKQQLPIGLAELVWDMLGEGASPEAVAEALQERGVSRAAAASAARCFDDRYQDLLRIGMRAPGLSEAEDLIERSSTGARPAPVDSPRARWIGVAVSALLLVGVVYSQRGDSDDIGTPCQTASDCPRNAACMIEVDEARRITGGYCTIACDDSSDCNSQTHCAKAYQASADQGSSWDGMLGKHDTVCVKYP